MWFVRAYDWFVLVFEHVWKKWMLFLSNFVQIQCEGDSLILVKGVESWLSAYFHQRLEYAFLKAGMKYRSYIDPYRHECLSVLSCSPALVVLADANILRNSYSNSFFVSFLSCYLYGVTFLWKCLKTFSKNRNIGVWAFLHMVGWCWAVSSQTFVHWSIYEQSSLKTPPFIPSWTQMKAKPSTGCMVEDGSI